MIGLLLGFGLLLRPFSCSGNDPAALCRGVLWRRLPKGHVWVAASALQPSFELWITPAGERVEQCSVLALHREMASGSELREHSVGFAHGERCLHRGLGGGDAAAVVPNGREKLAFPALRLREGVALLLEFVDAQ